MRKFAVVVACVIVGVSVLSPSVNAETPGEIACYGAGRICVFQNINRSGRVLSGV